MIPNQDQRRGKRSQSIVTEDAQTVMTSLKIYANRLVSRPFCGLPKPSLMHARAMLNLRALSQLTLGLVTDTIGEAVPQMSPDDTS